MEKVQEVEDLAKVVRDLERASQKLRTMEAKIDELNRIMNVYVGLLENKPRLVGLNLIVGLIRGLGITIGTVIVFAVLWSLLQSVTGLDVPYLSQWVADFIDLVEKNRFDQH